MAIYAISDLHLSKSTPNKSMEMFGEAWKDYESKIENNWRQNVKENDTVIIPGDISWALSLSEAKADFEYINNLPGKKIILKGNHDYYFTTATKVKKFLMENNFNTIEMLNNNSFFVEGYNICGFRGWGSTENKEVDDTKVFKRELIRLGLSLNSIEEENKACPIILATHFPPFRKDVEDILTKYNIKKCVYGHLHGEGHYMVKQGQIKGIEYVMVSGDYTGFKLTRLV